jgi:acetyl-CoA C-acetyltransferase
LKLPAPCAGHWEANVAYEHILVERAGPLTIVTINNPDRLNALDKTANENLGEIFDTFEADPDQWVAIITGTGDRAFSSGNDLRAQAEGKPIGWGPSGFGGLAQRVNCDKPILAAVNGLALGGGLEIALACDIVVAAEHAVFALPEVKVGAAALGGGLQRLPRQIGLKQAMHMILTGRRVSAPEALELGFVNSVVPQGEALGEARRIAEEILAASPMAVRASKQAVQSGLNEPTLTAALDAQGRYPAMRALFKSQDFKEGPRAFAAKRPPKWSGC